MEELQGYEDPNCRPPAALAYASLHQSSAQLMLDPALRFGEPRLVWLVRI
jgi:hypothetical protein